MASTGWNRRRHILVLLVIVAAVLAAAHISISSIPARGSSYPGRTNPTAQSEIFIDTSPPTVSVTTPSAGTTYTTDTMPDTFSGTVKDDDNGAGVTPTAPPLSCDAALISSTGTVIAGRAPVPGPPSGVIVGKAPSTG